MPATKAIPKEMLPLVDKPLIQYTVEEAKASGIEEVIFITGMGKSAIEDHFDTSVELELLLKEKGKSEILKDIEELSETFILPIPDRKKPLGLGHAVHCAKLLIGPEPFAVLLGDDIIDSKVPALKQMIDVFERYCGSIVAVQRVPDDQTHLYGVIDGEEVEPGVYKIRDLVEKPQGKAPSNLAIIGRYILTPEIFTCIENTERGSGGEIQLTDAIRGLLKEQDIFAYEFEGDRYDAGDKLGFLKANVSLALKRDGIGADLAAFLKALDL